MNVFEVEILRVVVFVEEVQVEDAGWVVTVEQIYVLEV